MEIRPDELYPLNLTRDDGSIERIVSINAKYDRVDHYKPLGCYMLKLFDDEVGLMCVFVTEENAMRVLAEAELPLVEREFIYKSEYEGYLQSQENLLSDWESELDIDEATIIETTARESDGD